MTTVVIVIGFAETTAALLIALRARAIARIAFAYRVGRAPRRGDRADNSLPAALESQRETFMRTFAAALGAPADRAPVKPRCHKVILSTRSANVLCQLDPDHPGDCASTLRAFEAAGLAAAPF